MRMRKLTMGEKERTEKRRRANEKERKEER
jgi:hypothetical protein